MKKNRLFVLVGALAILFTACNKDDTAKTSLTAAEAKAALEQAGADYELRAKLTERPAMKTLAYFNQLSHIDLTVKSAEISDDAEFNAIFETGKAAAYIVGDFDFSLGGEYEFDFTTNMFVKKASGGEKLIFRFPASAVDRSSKVNSGELVIDKFKIQDVKYRIPMLTLELNRFNVVNMTIPSITSGNLSLKVNGNQVLTSNYNVTLDADKFPVSSNYVTDFDSVHYDVATSQLKGVNSLISNLTIDGKSVLAQSLKLTSSEDYSTVKLLNGDFRIGDVKFSGDADIEKILEKIRQGVKENLNTINELMNITLVQSAQNAQIGKLEFRMRPSGLGFAEVPALVVVYSDGTFDYLTDVIKGLNLIEFFKQFFK